jgi:O-antigen/teichoic acid export membrane protein
MKSIIGSQKFSWAILLGKFGSIQIIVQLLGFCSGLLLVRILGKDVYALYTIANTMLGTMSVLSDSGVGSGSMALAGRAWNDKGKLSQVVKTALLLRHSFALAILFCLSPVLFIWLNSYGAGTGEATIATLIIALTLYLQTGSALLGVVPRILLQTDRLQLVEFLTSLVRLVAACTAALIFLNLTTALIVGAIAAAFQWALLCRVTKNDFQQSATIDTGIKSEILKIVARQAPNSVYYCIQSQVIFWLLGIFGNPSAIADAGALGRLAVVFTIAGNLLATMVMPRFSRCHSPELLWKRFHQVLGLLISALSILVLAAWMFPEQMLWILGKKYQNLENEFLLMVVAQSLNCLLTAISSLNIGKGWIVSPWLTISSGFLSYYLLFLWIGASSLKQVLIVGILASLVALVINYSEAIFSMRRMQSDQEKP